MLRPVRQTRRPVMQVTRRLLGVRKILEARGDGRDLSGAMAFLVRVKKIRYWSLLVVPVDL